MFKVLSISLALLLFVGTTLALADDIQPPPWRGQWSTTSQVWEFLTPEPGILPDLGLRPDGPAPGGQPPLPSTMLWVTPGPGMVWIPGDQPSGREGIWPLSGRMDVVVDNHDPFNEYKLVWVQVTWRPQDIGEEPIFVDLMPPAEPRYPLELVAPPVPLGSGWFESTYTWRIYPNPQDEWFSITGTIDVDELVIDTWCIPEPATLGLLLVGGVLALIRRTR